MLTTLDAPRAISEEPRSCHVASTHLGAANQPATAHLDPATINRKDTSLAYAINKSTRHRPHIYKAKKIKRSFLYK